MYQLTFIKLFTKISSQSYYMRSLHNFSYVTRNIPPVLCLWKPGSPVVYWLERDALILLVPLSTNHKQHCDTPMPPMRNLTSVISLPNKVAYDIHCYLLSNTKKLLALPASLEKSDRLIHKAYLIIMPWNVRARPAPGPPAASRSLPLSKPPLIPEGTK